MCFSFSQSKTVHYGIPQVFQYADEHSSKFKFII